MTRYAIDESRSELVAIWETGYGAVAIRVAPLAVSIEPRRRLALAAELSGLSRALWRCYTHPASAAGSLALNTEGWRREQTRNEFASVTAHIRKPNLPEGNSLMVSYDPVEECAHRVGRCLHAAGDTDLTAAVVADVEAERAAVEGAELGDLSGRSAQAVQLTRQAASPVQVAAADRILMGDPLGGGELFLELDPTSACVAAAHWLQAAADVAADAANSAAPDVLAEADDIEALPLATPTVVLELMEIGLSPTDVVTRMICDAMAVAEGEAPDIDDLREKIEEAGEEAEQVAASGAEAVGEITAIRLTTLDPLRPARDMLEDLLSGIRGCWLLYRENAMFSTDLEGTVSDDELDGEINEAFRNEVRARAAADRHRLDLEDRK
ncbi:hypothetical protein [Micromonospora narathiwatensis]|uniref:Uncharacterized protein n=1 Tax=Micromonospora narathiwatensis TaxID=299146 RepID=A0A1A8Z9X6_9ACTN|nr:hypothetical protein [Micromonospora narathiwatensis]SBT40611.1 hypothetical protein GA0070621_1011 [Micromonospora narathiwatensis]